MRKNSSEALIALIFGALISFAFCISPPGLVLERNLLDSFSTALSEKGNDRRAIDETLVVALDDISFDLMAETTEGLVWPYPRRIHAKVIQHLLDAGARAIFVDIIFDLPSGFGPEDDARLAEVVRGQPVYLAVENTDKANTPLAPLLQSDEILVANSGLPLDIDGFVRWSPDAIELPRSSIEALFYYLGLSLERQPWPLKSAATAIAKANNISVENGQIRYFGPAGTVPYVSYYEVFDTELFKEYQQIVKDKVVFIGSTPSISITPEQSADVYLTAQGPIPGVEIHAQHYVGIARGAIARVVEGWPIGLGMLLWLIIQCRGSIYFDRPLPGFLFAGFSVLAWIALTAVLRLNTVIIPILLPISLSITMYVSGLLLKYFRERDERLLTRAQLFFYLPARVAEHVLSNPEDMRLGGEKKEVTVLFADVAGFTTLSEQYSAEEVLQLLQEHLKEMAEAIFANEGTLDKYLGDGIMAFWGAPQAQANHADLALAAANDMLGRVREQNKERRERGAPELVLRIGLHSGTAIVGNIGSELFLDYTAIGDTVNTSARLEGVNKIFGTRLILSQECVNALQKPPKELVEMGCVAVKGKAEPTALSTLAAKEDLERYTILEQALEAMNQRDYEKATTLLRSDAPDCRNWSVARFHLDNLERKKFPEHDAGGRAFWPLDSK